MELMNQIDEGCSSLEKAGDFFLAPARLFFGENYYLATLPDGNQLLRNPETFSSFLGTIQKVTAIAFLPLSLISSLFGLCLKALALQMNPELKNKYTLPLLINARTTENFSGKLPQSPWTPNCVNSQENSLYGTLYNADPIAVPGGMENPLDHLKNLMATLSAPNYKASNASLVEQEGGYLHYTYTVEIPTVPYKGTYIDDIDLFYDKEKGCIHIRSASRKGIRDAIHLDFNQPGANKKRIEAIREAFKA